MIERVVVEGASLEAVQAALTSKGGLEVAQEVDGVVVYCHESRDAVEEVTDALNDAGVACYVYSPFGEV